MSSRAFERNLARLARRHPDLATRVREADRSAIERVTGPRGATTLVEGGVRLGSAYDPAAEGRRLAADAAAEPADVWIAVGLGLGHPVEALLRAWPAPTVVHEPSPARLRALLELGADLPWLDHELLHWAADPDEVRERFAALYGPGVRARPFVHPAVAQIDPAGVREALEAVARAKNVQDVQGRTLAQMGAEWARLTAVNAPELLRSPSAARLAGRFRGVPAVVVAAGPSLDRQIPWLRRHADRVLVVAIGQALAALRRAGIAPHVVHVSESQDVAHQLTAAGPTEDLAVVLLASCHPGLFRVPVRARFALYPSSNPFAVWLARALGDRHGLGGGATVAHSAVLLAAALGASPVALVGQDLAFTGGRVYAAGSPYEMVGVELDGSGRFAYTGEREKVALFGRTPPPERLGLRQDVIFVEGWDGAPVPTSRAYASFRDGYAQVARLAGELGVRVVNCTEGGARIPGLEHAPLADVLEHALATAPADARDAHARLRACYDAAPRPTPDVLDPAIARSRRGLERVARAAGRGLRVLGGAEAEPQRGVLAGAPLARAERALRRALREVPWLDVALQPELLRLQAELRRAGPHGSEALRVAAHHRALFQAARAGAERGHALLDVLVEALGRFADEKDGAPACAVGAVRSPTESAR